MVNSSRLQSRKAGSKRLAAGNFRSGEQRWMTEQNAASAADGLSRTERVWARATGVPPPLVLILAIMSQSCTCGGRLYFSMIGAGNTRER